MAILTERIYDQIKHSPAERTGRTVKRLCADMGANPPVPPGFAGNGRPLRRPAWP